MSSRPSWEFTLVAIMATAVAVPIGDRGVSGGPAGGAGLVLLASSVSVRSVSVRSVLVVVVVCVLAASEAAGAFGGGGAFVGERAERGEVHRVLGALTGCPDSERGAVVDKTAQRFWLCEDGRSTTFELPMTTASERYGLPPIGTHYVFSKDMVAGGIGGSVLERFVSFYRTPRGNRIGFHKYVDQDPSTIGDLDQRGASAGCLRVSVADSWTVWNHLRVGDPVIVISP